MAGASWILDKNRIATKIKSASGSCDHQHKWKSNPTKSCPNCNYVIDNSDAAQEWPGLPRGVKFDPTDQEIIWHLLTKVGFGDLKPHPFIDEFIPTVENAGGICYAHPQNLPGVKQDGTVSHFFHRAIKAYNTGTRKRRKIHSDDSGDVRWHKTGRTKPISLEGTQKGCKKIMVLYITPARGSKAEKTSWVMHQYHLGIGEDEKEGDYIISKIFYQQQAKVGEKSELDFPMVMDTPKKSELGEDDFDLDSPTVGDTPRVHPITPESVTPDPPCPERRSSGCFDQGQELPSIECTEDFAQLTQIVHVEESIQPEYDPLDNDNNQAELDNDDSQMVYNNDDQENNWWDSESQNILNSQQLAEGLALCDELLRSQSPSRDESENKRKPCLADYTKLGAEDLKKDLEECQKLDLDLSNLPIDTPPEFRLSQLDFNSQDSFLAWGSSSKALD